MKAKVPKQKANAAVGPVPLDVVSLILLKATPVTLWSCRRVCKNWYTLLTSPEFVANRRSATGGTWLATLHHTARNARAGTNTQVVRSAWILIYNPLLNLQEKVSVPIYQVLSYAKIALMYDLLMFTSRHENRLTLHAIVGRSVYYVTWNPVSGSIQLGARHSRPLLLGSQLPQDVSGSGWTHKHSLSQHAIGLMAYSESCLKIFWCSSDSKWEFMGAMPEDMWQIVAEKEVFFVATPHYYLIWTQHAQEPEMIVLFQSTKGSWSWVDNIWHSQSHFCRWNEKPLVVSCF